MNKEPYKLQIEADLPKSVVEGKSFKVIYKIKNVDTKTIEKGSIRIGISWLMVGDTFSHSLTIHIETVQPNKSMDHIEQVFPVASGSTIFTIPREFFSASDGKQILLHDVDGKSLNRGEAFASVRARSHEEISEARALWISAFALVILIAFQLIDWFIRYHDLF
ncbi:MAG: hypothetical protein E3J73_01125 [Candidatus Bathyarchaeum sp.]|nr:MAG: hypothetical protein E3J73_01125 [Candidatus Bathyarchaeum sp.]